VALHPLVEGASFADVLLLGVRSVDASSVERDM